MKLSRSGVLLAFLQVLIVLSLGGKLLLDRAQRPRVWTQVVPVDPELPVRGRYLLLNLQVDGPPLTDTREKYAQYTQAHLEVINGKLAAVPDDNGSISYGRPRTGAQMVISPSVPFFIAEHANDPSFFKRREDQLWAEVTVPRKGPPRTIRLGIKRKGSDNIELLKLD